MLQVKTQGIPLPQGGAWLTAYDPFAPLNPTESKEQAL